MCRILKNWISPWFFLGFLESASYQLLDHAKVGVTRPLMIHRNNHEWAIAIGFSDKNVGWRAKPASTILVGKTRPIYHFFHQSQAAALLIPTHCWNKLKQNCWNKQTHCCEPLFWKLFNNKNCWKSRHFTTVIKTNSLFCVRKQWQWNTSNCVPLHTVYRFHPHWMV